MSVDTSSPKIAVEMGSGKPAAYAAAKDATSAISIPVRTTTLTGAIFNLTKSAVGAGTVFLPAIFGALGWPVATGFLLAGAAFCALSLYLLGRMAHHCETGDFFKLGRLALGKAGETGVSICLVLFLLGGLIGYASLTGTYFAVSLATLRDIPLPKTGWFSTNNFTVLAGALLIFPLACLKDMSALAKTSIFGMVCMLYIAGLLAYDAITYDTAWGIKSSLKGEFVFPAKTFVEYFQLICVFAGKLVFAFVNHFTIVSLVPVMKNPSAKARYSLIAASTGLAVLVYLLAGLGGYFRFGALATADVDALSIFTEARSKDASIVVPLPYTIAQIALGLVLVCSFPLLADPARACVDALIFGGDAQSAISPVLRHYLETALLVAIPVCVAYFFAAAAGKILGLFAGVCGSLLVFTFPGAFFLILARPFKYSVKRMEFVGAVFCIGLGIVLAVLAGIFGTMNLFK